ncbi:hypothetical protein JI739_13490 [Ramlibacter sp. AW1]|uniref:Uncharacterized protein n=1 Tax=Ramlibacter aurantiacus TaxID=2801330 RepID=A0A936ZKA8_9BURK|nr:hypothetical protein [Ramlibacter aurantiacus]MBL0421367.1 hypothetical protein [Ramlibacter aurantiacus]
MPSACASIAPPAASGELLDRATQAPSLIERVDSLRAMHAWMAPAEIRAALVTVSNWRRTPVSSAAARMNVMRVTDPLLASLYGQLSAEDRQAAWVRLTDEASLRGFGRAALATALFDRAGHLFALGPLLRHDQRAGARAAAREPRTLPAPSDAHWETVQKLRGLTIRALSRPDEPGAQADLAKLLRPATLQDAPPNGQWLRYELLREAYAGRPPGVWAAVLAAATSLTAAAATATATTTDAQRAMHWIHLKALYALRSRAERLAALEMVRDPHTLPPPGSPRWRIAIDMRCMQLGALMSLASPSDLAAATLRAEDPGSLPQCREGDAWVKFKALRLAELKALQEAAAPSPQARLLLLGQLCEARTLPAPSAPGWADALDMRGLQLDAFWSQVPPEQLITYFDRAVQCGVQAVSQAGEEALKKRSLAQVQVRSLEPLVQARLKALAPTTRAAR